MCQLRNARAMLVLRMDPSTNLGAITGRSLSLCIVCSTGWVTFDMMKSRRGLTSCYRYWPDPVSCRHKATGPLPRCKPESDSFFFRGLHSSALSVFGRLANSCSMGTCIFGPRQQHIGESESTRLRRKKTSLS